MTWTYVPATTCVGRESPKIAGIRHWIATQDPGGKSLGTYACRDVRGGSGLSVHAAGRALDWQPSSRARGDWLADCLSGYPEGGDIQLVIWQRRQWGGRRGPGWRPYTGADPHTGHLHIETRAWA